MESLPEGSSILQLSSSALPADPFMPLTVPVTSEISGDAKFPLYFRSAAGALSEINAGRPATVHFQAGAVQLNNSVISSGLQNTTRCAVGERCEFTVQLRDQFGNQIDEQLSQVQYTLRPCIPHTDPH